MAPRVPSISLQQILIEKQSKKNKIKRMILLDV